MDLFQIAEYGPSIFAIAAIAFIVIKFLKSQKERDDAFMNIITNHIEHNTLATEKNTTVLTGLKETLGELCFYIKKTNGKRK